MRKKGKPLRIVQKPMDYIGKLCLIVVGYNYQGVVERGAIVAFKAVAPAQGVGSGENIGRGNLLQKALEF